VLVDDIHPVDDEQRINLEQQEAEAREAG